MHEAVLVGVLYLGYAFSRTLAREDAGTAMVHAGRVWDLERWMRLPSEAAWQQAAMRREGLVQGANLYYANVHFPLTLAVLLWLYLRHPARYTWMRRTLATLSGLAMLVHLAYPLAPPRLLSGMVDTGTVYGQSVYGPVGTGLANQFAAMPSLHAGWSVVVAAAMILTLHTRWRWLWLLHPASTILVIVVTANHYWLDVAVALGLLVLALWVNAAWVRSTAQAASPPSTHPAATTGHDWTSPRFSSRGGGR